MTGFFTTFKMTKIQTFATALYYLVSERKESKSNTERKLSPEIVFEEVQDVDK